MQPIFYSKSAGKMMLTKYVNGALVRSSANSVFRCGAVQSIAPSINAKTSPIADGNSDWDAAEPDTGKEGSVVVNLGFMSPDLYAFLLGTTVADLSNKQMWNNDEEILIPATAPYVVTLAHTPALGTTILVGTDASAWVKTANVSAVPTALQYTISAAAATFNSADAGKSVFLTYDWTALAAKNFGLPKAGVRPVMELIISGEATGEDESTIFDSNIIVDRCKATGNINPIEMGKEPKNVSITFKVLKPRGTNKAVDFVYAQRP